MKAELLTDIKYRGNYIKAGVIVDLDIKQDEFDSLVKANAIKKPIYMPTVEIEPKEKVTKEAEKVEVEIEESDKSNKTAAINSEEQIDEKKALLEEAKALGITVKGSYGVNKIAFLIKEAKEKSKE